MPLHDDYESNLREAKDYELFVSDALSHSLSILPVVYRSRHFQVTYGESLTGIEIKLDRKFRASGNLFIETEESCHESKESKPSGIFHESDPWLFVIGDYSTFWLFGTRCLQREHASKSHRDAPTPTSSGFLLPVARAEEIMLRKWKA